MSLASPSGIDGGSSEREEKSWYQRYGRYMEADEHRPRRTIKATNFTRISFPSQSPKDYSRGKDDLSGRVDWGEVVGAIIVAVTITYFLIWAAWKCGLID